MIFSYPKTPSEIERLEREKIARKRPWAALPASQADAKRPDFAKLAERGR